MCLQAQMDEIIEKMPEGTPPKVERKEAYRQVIAKEGHGRVNGYGLGVNKSRLQASEQTQRF